MSREEFAETLQNLLDLKGRSQVGVARGADLNSSHLNRIIRGKREIPRRRTVQRLADELNLNGEETRALFESAGYTVPKDRLDFTSPHFE